MSADTFGLLLMFSPIAFMVVMAVGFSSRWF